MYVKADSPLTTLSIACCQVRSAPSVLANSRAFPKLSHTRTTLGSVNLSLPVHRADQSSGPRVATAIDSQRWTSVEVFPTAIGAVTPESFSFRHSARSPSMVRGGSTPHPESRAGMYHRTLLRLTARGTLQVPVFVDRRAMRSRGKIAPHPCVL